MFNIFNKNCTRIKNHLKKLLLNNKRYLDEYMDRIGVGALKIKTN